MGHRPVVQVGVAVPVGVEGLLETPERYVEFDRTCEAQARYRAGAAVAERKGTSAGSEAARQPAVSICRSWNFWTLPLGVVGNASINSSRSGQNCRVTRSAARKSSSSFSVSASPGTLG